MSLAKSLTPAPAKAEQTTTAKVPGSDNPSPGKDAMPAPANDPGLPLPSAWYWTHGSGGL